MEEPVTFDLWGVPRRERLAEARATLSRLRPGLARAALLRATTSAGASVLVGEALPWERATALRRELAADFDGLQLYQHDLGPTDPGLTWCQRHDVRFGGVLGCHVCRGWIAPALPTDDER